MLDLDSPEWRKLRVPLGDASRIPLLIRAFLRAPSMDRFDQFWDELTGVGDLAIHNAFFAALPHAVAMVRLLRGEALEQGLAQLGWGIALSGGRDTPKDLADSFQASTREVAHLAGQLLETGVSEPNRSYILAAFEAGNGRYELALSIIDDL